MGLDIYLQDKEENEIVYWRKVNQIFAWFERRFDKEILNCQEYEVDKDMLTDLLRDINNVLNKKVEPQKVLPTQEGFFFGGTEYNEVYYNELKITKEKIEGVLRTFDFENDQLYFYAWW